MKTYVKNGQPMVVSPFKVEGKEKWTLKEKLLLGLTPRQYLIQAVRNPFNWLLGLIFAVGLPLIAGRFIFGLSFVTHSSNDYPWGLFLAFGLFTMVPLSASGFMLGTTANAMACLDVLVAKYGPAPRAFGWSRSRSTAARSGDPPASWARPPPWPGASGPPTSRSSRRPGSR